MCDIDSMHSMFFVIVCVSNDIFKNISVVLKSVRTDASYIVSVFGVHLFSKSSYFSFFNIYMPTNPVDI